MTLREQKMLKISMLFILLLVTLLVASCVQVAETQNIRASQLAISSVRDLPVSYTQGSSFSLSPKYVVQTSLRAEQTQAIYQLYTDAIVKNLQAQGFVKAVATDNVSFHVGFALALSEDLSDDKINETFGVSPGLNAAENLTKGSVLIYIEDANTGKRVWRGIAQGFTHENLSKTQKKQRAESVVSGIMKQFYQTN